MKGANITFDSVAEKFEKLDYPGGIAVYGAKAQIEKASEDDTNDYQATFGLKITYTNGTDTDLDWELYMVEDQYSELNAEDTTICELKQKSVGNQTYFWYGDKKEEPVPNEAETGCTGTAITTKLTGEKGSGAGLGGKLIASGKLLKATSTDTPKQGTITSKTSGEEYNQEVDLSQRVINTTTGHDTKYYYLVIKYPNKNESQSATDAKKTISATLTIDGDPITELYTKSA